jgi:hypothetical protein
LSIGYITLGKDGVAISWNAVPGQNYLLQYKDSLDETNWTSLPPAVSANTPTLQATNTLYNPSNRFYRVTLLP